GSCLDFLQERAVVEADHGHARARLHAELVQERGRMADLLRPARGLVAEVQDGLALRPFQRELACPCLDAAEILERDLEPDVAAEDEVPLLQPRLALAGPAVQPRSARRFLAHSRAASYRRRRPRTLTATAGAVKHLTRPGPHQSRWLAHARKRSRRE